MSDKNSGYLVAAVFLVMLSVTAMSLLKDPEEVLSPIEFSSLLDLTNDQAVKSSIISYLVNRDSESNAPIKITPMEQAESLYNVTIALGDIREMNTTSQSNETIQRNVRFLWPHMSLNLVKRPTLQDGLMKKEEWRNGMI